MGVTCSREGHHVRDADVRSVSSKASSEEFHATIETLREANRAAISASKLSSLDVSGGSKKKSSTPGHAHPQPAVRSRHLTGSSGSGHRSINNMIFESMSLSATNSALVNPQLRDAAPVNSINQWLALCSPAQGDVALQDDDENANPLQI